MSHSQAVFRSHSPLFSTFGAEEEDGPTLFATGDRLSYPELASLSRLFRYVTPMLPSHMPASPHATSFSWEYSTDISCPTQNSPVACWQRSAKENVSARGDAGNRQQEQGQWVREFACCPVFHATLVCRILWMPTASRRTPRHVTSNNPPCGVGQKGSSRASATGHIFFVCALDAYGRIDNSSRASSSSSPPISFRSLFPSDILVWPSLFSLSLGDGTRASTRTT